VLIIFYLSIYSGFFGLKPEKNVFYIKPLAFDVKDEMKKPS